jgi:ubiquitin C-terminal hydrolase
MQSSPVKKQRLEEDTTDNDEIKSSPRRTQSFKDLQFADIESLLHGESSKTTQAKDKVQPQQEPKCKLVGGRMNTAGVSVTPFDGSCVAEEESSSTALKRAEQDDADSAHTKSNSPVDSYFTTEVRVCLTCDSCKYRRSHTETYLHLSLEIGQNCSSLEDGLRKFFAPEKREIKCEKCFCETAMQATEITKLPRAMLFHLKRFIVDVSPDYTSISYRKDQSPVSYEEDLFFVENGVLNEFLASDVSLPLGGNSYGIRSVVNHIGSSASCGHYTADAKRRYNGQREWSRFNDSIVSKISSTDAVENASRTAYMIMYEIEP